MAINRPLRVFLCHSSQDKPAVRELYQKLRAEPWIQPWLDEEELYPGQDWNLEIEKAVEAADAIIVCLTKNSINKEGYVQRELRLVLDVALTKPEDTIFVIPLRLEECELPRRLRAWQYADYFEGQRDRAFQRLLVSLKRRTDSLGLEIKRQSPRKEQRSIVEILKSIQESGHPTVNWIKDNKITLSNGMEFMRVPAGKFLMGSNNYEDEKPQHTIDLSDYWMAHYPVINGFYNDYITAKRSVHPVDDWEKKKDHPVVNIKWMDAMEYCQWLNSLLKAELPSATVLRLPTESEWEKAARGTDGREYPWGNTFDKLKCNSDEGGKRNTTSVGYYSPHGDSPFGCADMSGNVLEWNHSLIKPYPYEINDGREDEKASGVRMLRGGSFIFGELSARCASRIDRRGLVYFYHHVGFRICIAPSISK